MSPLRTSVKEGKAQALATGSHGCTGLGPWRVIGDCEREQVLRPYPTPRESDLGAEAGNSPAAGLEVTVALHGRNMGGAEGEGVSAPCVRGAPWWM